MRELGKNTRNQTIKKEVLLSEEDISIFFKVLKSELKKFKNSINPIRTNKGYFYAISDILNLLSEL